MTSTMAILLVLLSSFTGAVSTLLIKKGTRDDSFFHLFRTKFLWVALVLYACGSLLYVLALRFGELSVLYPLVSTMYIWTTLFSVKYLQEKMNYLKWAGLAGILVGITFIALGSW